jgi:phage-related protein
VLFRSLVAEGDELRRLVSGSLGRGIPELRIRRGRIHYRILYFLHERTVAVLLHGLKKEGRIPQADLDRALVRRDRFRVDPAKHTHVEDFE